MGFSDEGYMAEHLCWLSLKRFADSWQNIYYDERKPFETGTCPRRHVTIIAGGDVGTPRSLYLRLQRST